MWGNCPARHVKTYIHPAPLGLTDIVKIGKRFEDAPIWEIAERKLAQGIVDWNSCLVFDIMFCGVCSRIKYSNKIEGVCLRLTCIHVPRSVPSQFLATRHLLETQSWNCRLWRGTPDFCLLKIVIFIIGRCKSKMSPEMVSKKTRDKSADHDWWHHVMDQSKMCHIFFYFWSFTVTQRFDFFFKFSQLFWRDFVAYRLKILSFWYWKTFLILQFLPFLPHNQQFLAIFEVGIEHSCN